MKLDTKLAYSIGGIFLILLGVFFILWSSKKHSDDGLKVSYKKLDLLRKEAQAKKRIQQNKAELENYKTAPAISNGYLPVRDHSVESSGLQLESARSFAADDSGETPRQAPTGSSLEAQINDFLLTKQRYQQLSLLQKQKYVSDFKREALALGFRVEFNDKLEIIRFDRMPASEMPRPRIAVPPPAPSSGVDGQENYDAD